MKDDDACRLLLKNVEGHQRTGPLAGEAKQMTKLLKQLHPPHGTSDVSANPAMFNAVVLPPLVGTSMFSRTSFTWSALFPILSDVAGKLRAMCAQTISSTSNIHMLSPLFSDGSKRGFERHLGGPC